MRHIFEATSSSSGLRVSWFGCTTTYFSCQGMKCRRLSLLQRLVLEKYTHRHFATCHHPHINICDRSVFWICMGQPPCALTFADAQDADAGDVTSNPNTSIGFAATAAQPAEVSGEQRLLAVVEFFGPDGHMCSLSRSTHVLLRPQESIARRTSGPKGKDDGSAPDE